MINMRTVDQTIPEPKVLLYGDVNLNVMDGSAVWLVSMAEVLSRAGMLVDVLLKNPITEDRLVRKFKGGARVRFLGPSGHEADFVLTPRLAAQRILQMDSANSYDVIVARGLKVCQFIAGSPRLAPKSWLYVTDLPFPSSALTDQTRAMLNKIALSAKRMFAQTEEARAYLESIVPAAAGKTVLLPPMIPDEFYDDVDEDLNCNYHSPLRLAYAGKFAKRWRTLEMCGLSDELSRRGVQARVDLIGDKFQDDVKDPSWPDRMRAAVLGDGILWHGGMAREDTISVVRQSHIGLGWRDSSMDNSLEISTKALEYAATGVCPLLNRTMSHEKLFGEDYPFFVDRDEIGHVAEVILDGLDRLPEARSRVRRAAEYYSIGSAADRLKTAFRRAGVYGQVPIRQNAATPLRVVLAGHDFKFAGELVEMLQADPSVDLRLDEWTTLQKHDEAASLRHIEWADVVICEWAGPNAAWYSANKRTGQSLVVRLHAFELRGAWLGKIDSDAVDAVVCVSEHYREQTHFITGWPLEKILVIPNALDANDLDRPKQPGSNFRLGLVGMVPFIKRPDKALDVLEGLLALDNRYTLHIRGRMPWEYAYEWNKPLQQQAYMEFFSRIGSNELLKNRVVFEPFGADMGSWLTKIGYVLSPSTRESFHMAPAEGMASGAIPLFWDRPGAAEIFGAEYVLESTEQVIDRVAALTSNTEQYIEISQRVKHKAWDFDVMTVQVHWFDAIRRATGGII